MTTAPKRNKMVRALVGVGLCAAGLLLVLSVPRPLQHTFRIDAGGCHLVTDIVEPAGGTPQGYAVILHGLAANKRIMSYIAQGFASQGLRVFVPDLPGHGHTNGPFSFDRAEQCSENLLRELQARGFLDPQRTIVAGHSMGGAIALRVASRNQVGGVVAISPAPMHPIPGIPSEAIPFHGFGTLPPNTLVMGGGWEPAIIRDAAEALAPPPGDTTNKYAPIPHATHVSILFDPKVILAAQNWAASVLHIEQRAALPYPWAAAGFLLGLSGILTMTGPFLREILESPKQAGSGMDDPKAAPAREILAALSHRRIFLEFAVIALGSVGLLHFWIPLSVLHIFEGDYFASLLLFLGAVILALHWKTVRNLVAENKSNSPVPRPAYVSILLAAFAAILLCILLGAWIDLSFFETWPTAGRVARFLPFLLAILPYHFAEEFVLGPAGPGKTFGRLLTSLFVRLIVLLAIVAGIFFLHSGEILPVLLVTSFGLFSLGQSWGMSVVREVTGSPAAAALFGAILLGGFCLVVFPTT